MSKPTLVPLDDSRRAPREPHPAIASVEEIIEEARNGRMFILVDDEDRENEGDLVIPAQMATPDAINFMAKNGRGLVCLALTRARVEKLKLAAMSARNETPLETAFTVSIEAREGITTGISAADRARTIAVAIDSENGPEKICSPGHVFPLCARDGGVLVRAGHTEAAVDIARLAGLNPAGVICEIMKDDGTMARMDDLVAFAQLHGLKIGTIRDLIAYRRRHDSFVRVAAEAPFESEWGGHWKAVTFHNNVTGSEQIAFVKGELDGTRTPLVRMHTFNMLDDAFSHKSDRRGYIEKSMKMIAEAGAGAIVIINKDLPRPFTRTMRAIGRKHDDEGETEVRDYGIGAQILALLGVHDMVLLTNSKQSLVGLSAYGLNIVEQRPIL